MRRAVIDIGTNTVKVLVADVQQGQTVPVLTKDCTTRLGEGVTECRRLSAAAIARTLKAIDDYHVESRALGATDIIALTTSACRDAMNRKEFFDAVRQKCGLEVQLVSGDQEAELIFRGVSSDPEWTGAPLVVMDVGGGSAEFIQGRRGKMELSGVCRWERCGSPNSSAKEDWRNSASICARFCVRHWPGTSPAAAG